MFAVHCKCGLRLEVDDRLQGSSARCPNCQSLLVLPGALPEVDVSIPSEMPETGETRASLNPVLPFGMRITSIGDSPARSFAPPIAARNLKWIGVWGLALLAVAGTVIQVSRELSSATKPSSLSKTVVSKKAKANNTLATTKLKKPAGPSAPSNTDDTLLEQGPERDPSLMTPSEVAAENPQPPVRSITSAPPPGELYYAANQPPLQRLALFRKLRAETVSPLRFEGPGGDRNIIGHYQPNGHWRIDPQGLLFSEDKQSAALSLGRHADFELRADLEADGLGGWFVLFGWTGQKGNLLYNITLQKTSVWYLYEAENGKFVNRKQGLSNYRWTGRQSFRMRVVERSLQVRVGEQLLTEQSELPASLSGEVYLGTADTQYGPMRLRIERLEIAKP